VAVGRATILLMITPRPATTARESDSTRRGVMGKSLDLKKHVG
jgi:hypothetical protein